MSAHTTRGAGQPGRVTQAWLRALEMTAFIPHERDRTLPTIIQGSAGKWGDAPALLSDKVCFTYTQLAARQNQYARWALEQGIQKGEIVCLLHQNCPDYFAIWLGISSIGGVVALLNTNLTGASLAHCINSAAPKHIIVGADLASVLAEALTSVSGAPEIWIHGGEHKLFPCIDQIVGGQKCDALASTEQRPLTTEDRALCVFTSGTTGLPKAANVSHARILQWSYWFAGMLGIQASDRVYNCLPMYHSIGGVLVPGATLAGGGSVVVRAKFSTRWFWQDVIRWECTIFQYIGELCRYLLHGTTSSEARGHRLRMACGNGISAEIWKPFKAKFNIPRIVEFYASTEGGVSLFNLEEEAGSIGRVPGYLRHRFSPELVRCDPENCEPLRDQEGLCVQCGPNQAGEALGRLNHEPSALGTRFEGYTDSQATNKKILRNVFKPGDAWVRTGDLMRRDARGFYYFVDRMGDSFRWKGENVSTSEVSQAICTFPGVKHASVYGVRIPGAEGRAGMAAIEVQGRLEMSALRNFLERRLPAYARPLFLRLCTKLDVNGTFKYSKAELVRQGYNPAKVSDGLYFDDPEQQQYVVLDNSLFLRIQQGEIRL